MKIVIILLTLLCMASFTCAQTRKDVDNTQDPVVSLRDQIAAAPNAPERNRLQLKLADLLLTTGHKPEAMTELNSVAHSTDFDPVGFYNLGNTFARLGETEAAITAYRAAINQRSGRYSRAYNNLGVVLLRAGRWDEAYDALVSALKIESFRYAEASYNLGRLYAARGQVDLAVREWRRALAVDPRHSAAAQALARAGREERISVEEPVTNNRPTTARTVVTERSKGSASRNPSKPLALDPMSF